MASDMIPQIKLSLTSKSVSEDQFKIVCSLDSGHFLPELAKCPVKEITHIYFSISVIVVKYILYPMHHYRDLSI